MSLTPAKTGAISPLMNPTQKQFSLNRGASRKQIPISSRTDPFTFTQNQLWLRDGDVIEVPEKP